MLLFKFTVLQHVFHSLQLRLERLSDWLIWLLCFAKFTLYSGAADMRKRFENRPAIDGAPYNPKHPKVWNIQVNFSHQVTIFTWLLYRSNSYITVTDFHSEPGQTLWVCYCLKMIHLLIIFPSLLWIIGCCVTSHSDTLKLSVFFTVTPTRSRRCGSPRRFSSSFALRGSEESEPLPYFREKEEIREYASRDQEQKMGQTFEKEAFLFLLLLCLQSPLSSFYPQLVGLRPLQTPSSLPRKYIGAGGKRGASFFYGDSAEDMAPSYQSPLWLGYSAVYVCVYARTHTTSQLSLKNMQTSRLL